MGRYGWVGRYIHVSRGELGESYGQRVLLPLRKDSLLQVKAPITHRLASPLLSSPLLSSPLLSSPHLTSPHLTSPHLTSPHLTSHLKQNSREEEERGRERGKESEGEGENEPVTYSYSYSCCGPRSLVIAAATHFREREREGGEERRRDV